MPNCEKNRPELQNVYVHPRSRAKKAFQLAIREARAAGAVRAEPEHVLLGLLDGCGGVAALVLTQMGVDAEKVREQIREQATGETNGHA